MIGRKIRINLFFFSLSFMEYEKHTQRNWHFFFPFWLFTLSSDRFFFSLTTTTTRYKAFYFLSLFHLLFTYTHTLTFLLVHYSSPFLVYHTHHPQNNSTPRTLDSYRLQKSSSRWLLLFYFLLTTLAAWIVSSSLGIPQLATIPRLLLRPRFRFPIMPSTDTALPPAPELFSRWGALQTWWGRTNKEQAQIAEARLLSRLQFFSFKGVASTSADSSSTVARVGLVELSGKNRKINTLIIQQKPSASVNPSTTDTTDKDTEADDQGRTPIAQTTLDIHTSTDEHDGSMISPPAPGETAIVICHGYGAGLGFFYRNYHSLSQIPNAKIYAIDWLGMGGSSRPDFKFKHSSKTPVNDVVKQAEDFFISALEELREVQKIDKMILIGHSLGGYLSAVYALKYPERVEKLILASPGKLLFFSFSPGCFFFFLV